MAIPETELKQSSAIVEGTNEISRDIGSVKTVVSSDKGTLVSYNMFKSIKDFHFSMPSGWNDHTLAIFIESCKQNKELLSEKDENLKWAAIAECGARKSKHPTLFKLNSCMELAEAIRSYVVIKSNILEGNANFRRFCDDISDMLPFFPDKKEQTPLQRNKVHLAPRRTIKNAESKKKKKKKGNAKCAPAGPSYCINISENQGPQNPPSNMRLKQRNASNNKQSVDVNLTHDKDEDIPCEDPDSPKVQRVRKAVRGSCKLIPSRNLPLREAKIRSKTIPSRRHNSARPSEYLFKGFEEDVSFEGSSAVQQNITLSLEEYQMNIPNTDTTNASSDFSNPDTLNASRDDSDSGYTNAPRNLKGGTLNFGQGQRVKKKSVSLNMLPDGTMKPVVLLNKLDISQTSGYVDPSLPSTSGKITVESAVVAEDIVKRVHDHLADSAKIIADPPSHPQPRIVGGKRQVFRRVKNGKDSEPESSGMLTNSGCDFKSYNHVKSSPAKMARDSLSKPTCAMMQGTSADPWRPGPQTQNVSRPPSRSESTGSSRSIDLSSRACSSDVDVNLTHDKDEDIPCEDPDSPKVQRVRKAVRGSCKLIPSRNLPLREAKIRSKTIPSRRHNSARPSEYLFKGFEEDVSFEGSSAVQQNITLSLEEYQMNIPNTDTTNASSDFSNPDTLNASRDDSDSGYTNAPHNLKGGTLNFGQGQRVKKKSVSLNMLPDGTMKPVVLLNKLDISQTSGYVDLSLPSTSGKTTVESAVVAEDIVKRVHDHLADSAKIIADPPSHPQPRIVGGKRQIFRRVKNGKDSEPESSGMLTNSGCDFKSYNHVKSSPAKMARDSLSKPTCAMMQGTSADPWRPGPQTQNVSRPPSRSESTGSSRSIDLSSRACSSDVPGSPVNAVAMSSQEGHQTPSSSSQMVELYQQRPAWLNDFVQESRNHVMWKIKTYQKMQKDIMVSENKGCKLLEQLINVLASKK